MTMTKQESRKTDVLMSLHGLERAYVALKATVDGLYSAGKDIDVSRYRAKQEALVANMADLLVENDRVMLRLERLAEEL